MDCVPQQRAGCVVEVLKEGASGLLSCLAGFEDLTSESPTTEDLQAEEPVLSSIGMRSTENNSQMSLTDSTGLHIKSCPIIH